MGKGDTGASDLFGVLFLRIMFKQSFYLDIILTLKRLNRSLPSNDHRKTKAVTDRLTVAYVHHTMQ